MQKVILDTNVIVSALIQRSYPYLILNDLYLGRRLQLCVSDELLAEYRDVLNRDKFSRFPDFTTVANIVLSDIYVNATLFHPHQKVDIISDKDDNKLLELAIECNADYLVTGNTNDFTIQTFQNTRIVSPKEFWEIFL